MVDFGSYLRNDIGWCINTAAKNVELEKASYDTMKVEANIVREAQKIADRVRNEGLAQYRVINNANKLRKYLSEYLGYMPGVMTDNVTGISTLTFEEQPGTERLIFVDYALGAEAKAQRAYEQVKTVRTVLQACLQIASFVIAKGSAEHMIVINMKDGSNICAWYNMFINKLFADCKIEYTLSGEYPVIHVSI